MLIDFLFAQNYCISQSRTLLSETAIANAVVKNTKKLMDCMYSFSQAGYICLLGRDQFIVVYYWLYYQWSLAKGANTK